MPYTILGDIQTLTLSPSAQCDNPCCILTLNNEVQLMGNIILTDYEADTMFATLPESMRPMNDVVVPVFLGGDTGAILVPLLVTAEGELSISQSVTSSPLYLNGVSFSCCDRYYNANIGNNFSQGTSPLRWDGEAQ